MRLPLLPAVLLLVGCGLSQPKFEDNFEDRYCIEYENCFDEFSCDETPLERDDYSDCDYNMEAAQDCLGGDWTCVTNQGQPFVSIPASCGQVYTNCNATSGTTIYYYDGTGTGTGTGTGSGTTGSGS